MIRACAQVVGVRLLSSSHAGTSGRASVSALSGSSARSSRLGSTRGGATLGASPPVPTRRGSAAGGGRLAVCTSTSADETASPPKGKTFDLKLASTTPAGRQIIFSQADFQAVLRTYNLAALSGPSGNVYSYDGVEGGQTYSGVAKPRPPPPRPPPELTVSNVTFRLDAMAGHASDSTEITYAELTDFSLADALRAFDAAGLVQILAGEEPLAAAAAQRAAFRTVKRLEDNGVYLMIPVQGGSLRNKVRNLERDQQNVSEAFEQAAGERVATLIAKTHSNVRRLCHKVHVPVVNEAGKLVDVEVDEIVVTDTCAFIVEVENVLTELSTVELLRRIKSIRERAASPDCPELLDVRGKSLHGVLCGGQIKPVNPKTTRADIEDNWRGLGFRWLLVNGEDLGVGDTCSPSADFSS